MIMLVISTCTLSNAIATVHQVPEIGKPCPDFKLNNLVNSKQKQVSLKDFRGKWLMIDIWAPTCTSCVRRLPEINRLQQIFRNELTVLLIGYNDYEYDRDVKKMYLQLQDRMHLQLLAAFDSVLLRRWHAYSVPYIVLVNPAGLVYTITNGIDMDSAKIRQMIDGKNPSFRLKTYGIEFDREKPLLINNNGGPDTGFLYRSLLTRYVDEDYPGTPVDIGVYYEKNKVGFQVIAAALSTLYQYAYIGEINVGFYEDSLYGKVSPNLVLETSDSSMFKPDLIKMRNLFNYSLYVPPGKANRNYLMLVLQRELKNCFGYEVRMENREADCWLLKLRKDTVVSLKSKELIKLDSITPMEIRIRNGTLKELIFGISEYCRLDRLSVYDETGIDYPVDIQINALLTELTEVQQELRRNGLELVRGKKMMKVIVIRDPIAE
jgi:thiol-disulfide isomerase/thioredoxin